MARKVKRVKPENELKYIVCSRVTDEEYSKLVGLLPHTARYKMSGLLRHILENRPIRIFTLDKSMSPPVAELGVIRQRIGSTGQKVNQYTHRFNAARSEAEQRLFAKLAISLAASVGPNIDRLLEIAQIGIKEFLEENEKRRGLQSGTRPVSNVYKLATELAAAADRL